ncbi:CBPQ-like protein [Mya arenaria]|uniref:Carboxypeptidase Q n=1 Tax=Mya arenaria TaxID=6604 RepID=A0ABY7FDN4_MYAAR|nr:CBPQ-like protein [Mya arenaria]
MISVVLLVQSSLVAGIDINRVRKQVASYKDVANRIIDLSLNGAAQNQSYNRLATFTDKFGYRLAGSQNLEDAIDYMLEALKMDQLENVHGENAVPRVHKLPMLGLGYSVGTGPQGIKAEVIVVKSFDELEKRATEVPGKIVVYNQDYHGYGISVRYRASGAAKAAKHGAVASLIRSVTPLSVDSPHTGMQVRWVRGEQIEVFLNMSAQNLPNKISRNTVAEIKGSLYPEQGAMDDGGGAFISWQALSLVRQLGLRPKRTLRLVLWTAEEFGGVGSQSYFNEHKLLKQINASNLDTGGEGTDISPWMKAGVPGASLANMNQQYFYWHHTNGDTMTVQDPVAMNLCSAVWAVTAYVVADLDEVLPRDNHIHVRVALH